MKSKLSTTVLPAIIFCILLVLPAYSQIEQTVNFYAWTDKPYYSPGEKGTLFITIRNDRADVDLVIKKIEIYYPWFTFSQNGWEGNSTKKPDFKIKVRGQKTYFGHDNFEVPGDGRAVSGVIMVKVYVDKTPFHYPEATRDYYEIPINIAGSPQYEKVEGLEKIETLLTIQAILIIICTVIIASTIFLSIRRPPIVLEKEERR